MTNERLRGEFFDTPCLELAKNLLGTILVRKLDDGTLLKGKIVETECYAGGEDKGSYSFNGRRTPANEPMYMKSGTLFVYLTYGMYHCINISSKGDGSAVLLRAVEPLQGLNEMENLRRNYRKTFKGKLTAFNLCDGPSKLCVSFAIDKTFNKADLSDCISMWLEGEPGTVTDVIACKRIGIDRVAGPVWANKPLRFYERGNDYVSKIDKEAEKNVFNLEIT